MNDKKKIIIGTLCALVMIMAVGYALLGQSLTISGTSSITSSWQVEITNIREKAKSTGATTNSTSYTATTASFNVGLTSPGDYATYEVTVTNKGTLDAVLSAEPSVTTDNNTAIIYELSGISEGDKLSATTNNTKTFTIKVQYNPNTTSQPNVLTSDIEVTLSYEQDLEQNTGQNGAVSTAYTGTLYRNNPMQAWNGTVVDGEGYCIVVSYNGQPLKYCANTLANCEYLLAEASRFEDLGIDTSESTCSVGSITLQESLLTTYTEQTKSNISKNYYLKHIINNGVLEESYACFVTDREYCMKGGNPVYYSTNVEILESNETWFENHEGECSELDASGSSSSCDGAGFDDVYADSSGNVESSAAGVSCSVGSDGNSLCIE